MQQREGDTRFFKELLVSEEEVLELKKEAMHLPSWDLTQRQVWDIELLLNGAFSPLDGFLSQADFDSVCKKMRLRNGSLWPIPIILDVSENFAASLFSQDRLALRHPEGMILAVLTVQDIWRPDLKEQAQLTYGTTDETHTGVFYLFHRMHPVYVGGSLKGIEQPPHHTFQHLRHTPLELRRKFKKFGWQKVVAFQTRNPMHRAHVELTK
ncbi:MAG: adenylyltransferase, partial [Planctomycetota bacterium]